MNKNEIALKIFCALMSRPDATIDLDPHLGEKQIRTCFMLAETFQLVADEASTRDNVTPVKGGQ